MSLKTEQYLQKISQCLYDITEIINAHIIEPIKIDKELDKFYFIERNKLIKLTEERVVVLDIIELNNNLPDSLIFNNNGTELLKKQTESALNYLSIISSKIQHKRDFSSSKPTTGIENGGLKKYLEKLLNKSKSTKQKNIIDIEFPEKIEWSKVTIKIKDGLKDIEISYDGKFVKLVSFNEIGFSSSKKELKENRQWELLKILSVLLIEDEKLATPLSLAEMLTRQTGKKITTDNVYKMKKSLAESLKYVFKTEEDPFIEYKNIGYYKVKFKLLPQPELRNKGEIWSNPSGYNDNIESNSDEYKGYGED